MRYIILITTIIAITTPTLAHSHAGGCRKADRPLCCHTETKTGTDHCH